jgi:hypothetical protein
VFVVGVLVLCITTVVAVFNLPGQRWGRHGWVVERRQHRRRASDRRAHHHGSHGMIAATTVRLADTPAPGAAIALPSASTSERPIDQLDDPEAVITHLLDTDPQLLARVMSEWIRDDGTNRGTPPTEL